MAIQHNTHLVRRDVLCLSKKKKKKKERHRLILNLGFPPYLRRLEAAKKDGNQFWATS